MPVRRQLPKGSTVLEPERGVGGLSQFQQEDDNERESSPTPMNPPAGRGASKPGNKAQRRPMPWMKGK